MDRRFTCVDLFSGAGGLSRGFMDQAVYRQDRRDKRIDHDKLRVIMDEAEDDALKVGAAIVAGEHEKARKWLAEMQNVKREEFLHFPIANLLSKQ